MRFKRIARKKMTEPIFNTLLTLSPQWRSHLICFQTFEVLWIFTIASANYCIFTMVSANCPSTLWSLSIQLSLSLLPLHLFLSPSATLSLSPLGPLLRPINRRVGGDGGPLRETEHFGWFPEKGNDRPRQYPPLHLLQTLSALLTRLEANTQRT